VPACEKVRHDADDRFVHSSELVMIRALRRLATHASGAPPDGNPSGPRSLGASRGLVTGCLPGKVFDRLTIILLADHRDGDLAPRGVCYRP